MLLSLPSWLHRCRHSTHLSSFTTSLWRPACIKSDGHCHIYACGPPCALNARFCANPVSTHDNLPRQFHCAIFHVACVSSSGDQARWRSTGERPPPCLIFKSADSLRCQPSQRQKLHRQRQQPRCHHQRPPLLQHLVRLPLGSIRSMQWLCRQLPRR